MTSNIIKKLQEGNLFWDKNSKACAYKNKKSPGIPELFLLR